MSKYALSFGPGKLYEILCISMLPNPSVELMQFLVLFHFRSLKKI